MLDASLQGGVIVCQHWQLRRGLGSSPGQAWEAEDLRSGGRVAIKFLRGSQSLDESSRQRFEREARAFGRVRSPHYVQILDQGISEHGQPFLVTEALDGEELGTLLARQPRLSFAEVGWILDQLLRALSRLQTLRLVHRDIHPENVFLVDDVAGRRSVKLLNFGLARWRGRDSSPLASGAAWHAGAEYWSPEQIAAPARVDQRTDVWAVGVLGYRMLTGKPPFPAEDWPTLAQRAQIGKFAPVSALRDDVPAALDAWLHEMLQPNVLARFAGAEPARLALEQIVPPDARRAPRSGPPPLPRAAPSPLPPPEPAEPVIDAAPELPAVSSTPDAPAAASVVQEAPPILAQASADEGPPAYSDASESADSTESSAPAAAVSEPPEAIECEVLQVVPSVSAIPESSAAVATVSEPPEAIECEVLQAAPSASAIVSAPAVAAALVSRVTTVPVEPVAERGVRVGTLLAVGLVLIAALGGLFALRSGRTHSLRSQAAASERPPQVEPPQPSAARPAVRAELATAAPAPAPASISATPPTPAAVTAEPSAPPAAPPLSTPVAVDRLRSRSAGARLSPGPAGLPVMEGGPRVKRSYKAAAPADVDPPAPAPSAPPPTAAARPYRGF